MYPSFAEANHFWRLRRQIPVVEFPHVVFQTCPLSRQRGVAEELRTAPSESRVNQPCFRRVICCLFLWRYGAGHGWVIFGHGNGDMLRSALRCRPCNGTIEFNLQRCFRTCPNSKLQTCLRLCRWCQLLHYWGGIPSAMSTCFMAVTGGCTWSFSQSND